MWPPSVINYMNLSTFFTFHCVVSVYLSRANYMADTVLCPKIVPSSRERS